MKDLNPKEVYDLRGITEEQAVELLGWLILNDSGWNDNHLKDLLIEKSLEFGLGSWSCDYISHLTSTKHISTLFEKSLDEELEEAEKKVSELKKQIEERDKPKIGDVCKFYDSNENEFIIDVYCEYNSGESTYKHKAKNLDNRWTNIKKLTQQEVIDLLFGD